MRNPFFEFDESSVDGDSEPPHDLDDIDVNQNQAEVVVAPEETDDGNRALLQDEDRHGDDLKERFIGTIDQGTTSTRFIIFDCTGVPIAKYQTEFRQIHEHPGYAPPPLNPPPPPLSQQQANNATLLPKLPQLTHVSFSFSTDGTNKTLTSWWSRFSFVSKRP